MPGPEDRTGKYLASVRNQPSLLLAFLRAMPKGADLHMHLSGAIYAENYIKWAAADGLCLHRPLLSYAPAPCDAEKGLVPAQQVLNDAGLYAQVINALSMRQFNGPESGHDHFFNTFGKFSAVSRTHQGDMLAEVASRAAMQNVSMLSLLLAPDKGEAGRFPVSRQIAFAEDLPAMRTALLDAGIKDVVERSRKNLDQFESRMRDVLKCGTPESDAGCDVIIRYQFEIHRGLPPDVVFAEMLTGFELAASDPRVIDVNPVMPEDGFVEMRDFNLHMRMIDYLKSQYPGVRLSLHAGELWHGLVPLDGLRDHIRKSISLGHAERIGHGVDVMFEDDPFGLIKEMAAKKIAVEINLSSNGQILGVRGNDHPLPIYMKFGVPVVISTDDEGVARSGITNEYMIALRNYDISYSQLKKMVRDSLEYSFLPGESLWNGNKRLAACAKDSAGSKKVSAECQKALESSERANAQWKLEQQFAKFEMECCSVK
mgnify:CR=1 FL=1